MKQGRADSPVEEIQCDSLDEFWDLLSPIGRFDRRFIFRGQGDADWHLIPSVLRESNLARYRCRVASESAVSSVIAYELDLLKGFIGACDIGGLPIYGDSSILRLDYSDLYERYRIDIAAWPEKEFWPVLALAQHHKVPTRLLDWTCRSYVAAYFSAVSALEAGDSGGEHLAVWVIQTDLLELLPAVELVKLPGAISPNMAAQQGCFVVVRPKRRQDRYSPAPSHEEYGRDSIDALIVEAGENDILTKITLPIELAGDLLLRCDRFGVSAATLFPGYDGAALSALEFRLASNIKSKRLK